jgi:hypothetical protein
MLQLQSFRASRWPKLPRFSALLLAAGISACAHNPPPRPELGTPEANVLVTVKNQNVNDVDVFLLVNGIRQRLGTVVSQGSGNFEIPWDRIGPSSGLSLIVAPIGAPGAYRTGQLTVQPGAQIALAVAPVLRNSSIVIT